MIFRIKNGKNLFFFAKMKYTINIYTRGKDELPVKDGFLKVAAVTPAIRTTDCHYNAKQIITAVQELPEGTALAVFPELCLTGATCGDLFFQPTLQRAAEDALRFILNQTIETETILLVGVPVAVGAELYNCAAVCLRGKLLGLVPKQNLTNHSALFESRVFSSGKGVCQTVTFAEQTTCLSADVVFTCRSMPEFSLGVELCEDLWVAEQPSIRLAAAGATVIANLSASDEAVTKDFFRRDIVSVQSARLCAAYIYADAGEGESVSDVLFSGHNLIAENGAILTESRRFSTGSVVTEVDLQKLLFERRRITPFECTELPVVEFDFAVTETSLSRTIDPYPFIPSDPEQLKNRCEDVLNIQSAGLAQRLRHTGCQAVLGLSGGLDSALALLVTVRAYNRLERQVGDICAVTMPCFGTTGRTYHNACELAKACGVTLCEVPIADSVRMHFKDIGHSGNPDLTYENAQARERTQVLMDIANANGSLVVGTGDLSELALGWATYNGDHMSMYGVNASVPKTLVRRLVEYEAKRCGGQVERILADILDTPVSPELLPPENDVIAQKTESIVGNYDLHDFFLYYMLRFGFSPAKLYRLACLAFGGKFDRDEIKNRLCLFLRRFFSQQFKRNCMPDGPKVGSVGLSPRGAWHMPSDAVATVWLREAETL